MTYVIRYAVEFIIISITCSILVPRLMKFIIKKQKNWKFKIISEEKSKEKKSTKKLSILRFEGLGRTDDDGCNEKNFTFAYRNPSLTRRGLFSAYWRVTEDFLLWSL